MTRAASDGAPALVPSATTVVKVEVPSPGVGSPPRRFQQWAVGAGLSLGPYIELRVPVSVDNHPESIPQRNRKLLQNLLRIQKRSREEHGGGKTSSLMETPGWRR
jgi:hypothetical protein